MDGKKLDWTLSLAIILAAFVVGLFFYLAKLPAQKVQVVGYATQNFEADFVKWSFNLSTPVSINGLNEGYRQMNQKLSTFRKLWSKMDISFREMQVGPVSVQKTYGEYGKIIGYNLDQNIYIVSEDIESIEKITINPVEFTKYDLAFEYSRIEYFSSKLEEIKKQLLSQATLNARERAQEIVAMTESGQVGKMLSARSGVFQITEPYSTEIAGYGIHSTSTRKKTIKVTVNVIFIIN